MSNGHEPTEHRLDGDDEFAAAEEQVSTENVERELAALVEPITMQMREKAEGERYAHDAALELLSRGDRTIFSRPNEDGNGSVQVTRRLDGNRHIVVKACTGTLSVLEEEEIHSLIRIERASEIRQVITYTTIESALRGRPDVSRKITMPYAGLDLSKWECLLKRDGPHNPFFRVDFHLNLASSMLTALEAFHKRGFLHCDIKLNNWCIEGTFEDLHGDLSAADPVIVHVVSLDKLTLIDLGFAMTQGRELPKFANGMPFGVTVKEEVEADWEKYVAPSYQKAVDAARDGDRSLLDKLSWKIDLFSLGKLFEGLDVRYGFELDKDTATPKQREFLRSLPGMLCRYELDAESQAAECPHDRLRGDIERISPRKLEYFRIHLLADELALAVAEENKTPSQGADQIQDPGERKIDDRETSTGDKHEVQRPGSRWLKSIAALAAFAASLLLVWSFVGPKPPVPKVFSRDDPVFAKCDALRVKAVSGSALTRQDYSFAIGLCSEFLQLTNAPPDLRFDALITRAVAFEKTDRWHEALEDLALAESINPKDPGVDLNRSLVLSRQGNFHEAIAALGAAIDKGWRDGPLIEKDADYDAITKSPLYQSIRIRLGTIK